MVSYQEKTAAKLAELNRVFAEQIERGEMGEGGLQQVKDMLAVVHMNLARNNDGSETWVEPAISLIYHMEDIAMLSPNPDNPKQDREQRMEMLWKSLGLGSIKESREERDILLKAAIYKLHHDWSRRMDDKVTVRREVERQLMEAGTPKSAIKENMAAGKKTPPKFPYDIPIDSLLFALERENSRFKKRGKAS